MLRFRLVPTSAVGWENVVAGMFRLLPMIAVYMVANLFARRYSGEVCEQVETWKSIAMIFLPKVASPECLDQFRGISLLPVMSKWYMQCLYILARRSPLPKAWNMVAVFSYQCCLSTAYITSALQLLVARGWEWQLQQPIYVFSGDIKGAFDHMKPDVVVKALRMANLHPRLVAALLMESAGAHCLPEFDGLAMDRPVSFNKCAKQGGVDSAYEWNCVMYMCL